jgi:hypothetical protein
MTASTKKAQGGSKGKAHGAGGSGVAQAAEALHALYSAGAFDFINNMLGRTVGDVSARLGIGRPAKFGDPQERPTVEDFAAWLARIPPTFDPADEQEEGSTRGGGVEVEPAYDIEQKNPLTREEAKRLLETIHGALSDTGDAALSAAFLLLVNALAFEEDRRARLMLWGDARSMFALELAEPYYALERALGAALADLRKGGE